MDCPLTTFRWTPITLCLLLFLTLHSTTSADTTAPPAAPAASPDKAQPTPLIRAFRNDATLNDIVFATPKSGWAVGDRGVIWHTDDAGTTWRQQAAPVSCTLSAVFFVDSRRGWTVGGECQPYTNATRGEVLRTDDGGATWLRLPQPLLPLLTGVKFFDRDHGIAFGQSASHSPSGVFSTRDGGVNWQPLPSDDSGNWLAGDFLAPDAGAFAGPAGQIATLVRHKVVPSPLAASSLRSLRAMRLIAPAGGWAVGDGGLLLTTSDLGHSWQTPPANPLQRAGTTGPDNFDFQAVAALDRNIWIAGTPGTRIFHSSDNGNTWQSTPTGQTTPLRALSFIDSQHGWAAGALGSILTTHDGGKSWQPQRCGARRAALFAIFADPTDIPLELLADSGAVGGYIATVDLICTSADSAPASAGGARPHEAMLLAGAAATNTSWQFPLPPADLALSPADLLAALNRENDGRALHQLETHLVRQLRTWRPDVVVIPTGQQANPRQPLTPLIERLVAEAIESAADPNQHTELATDIGLAPWQVKKVYGVVAPGLRGEDSIDPTHFSPWLGTTLAVFASPARTLLFRAHTPPPEPIQLKLLTSRIETNPRARGLFNGITLAPGSEARRPQPDLPVQDFDALRRLAERRRNLEQLLQRTQGNAAWSAQVNQMLEGLSDDDTGHLLVELAEGYRKTGRLDLAADTYFLLARRTPDHPLVDPALTWLVQFYSSAEISHRLTTRASNNMRRESDVAQNAGPSHAIKQATALTPISATAPAPGLSRDDRFRRAAQLADYLKTARPALYADPSIRFAEVIAQRQLGFANPAKRLFLSLRQFPATNPWRQCAETEEWLEKPGDTPPAKKLGACRRAPNPPHLDGQLNDPFWDTADRLALRGENSPPRTNEADAKNAINPEVRLAHDNDFLYVAIRCPKAANVDYQTDDAPRPRDADLTQHDRVSVRLDIDRDYTTAFELTIDNRGWTNDACWGDATWDPTWYVATSADEKSWTIEAAIPLAELTPKPPAARDVWALAIRRTIPRTGYQTWSAAPPSDESPSQFGLLLFE